nr:hypothetical protein [uncultured Actinoplanes sp.]
MAFALRLIVEKVLGDWNKTVQLLFLALVPLLVFGGAGRVAAEINLDTRSLGIIGGCAVTAAAGVPATLGVIRRIRRRRQISAGDAEPPQSGARPRSGDETPKAEGE